MIAFISDEYSYFFSDSISILSPRIQTHNVTSRNQGTIDTEYPEVTIIPKLLTQFNSREFNSP